MVVIGAELEEQPVVEEDWPVIICALEATINVRCSHDCVTNEVR